MQRPEDEFILDWINRKALEGQARNRGGSYVQRDLEDQIEEEYRERQIREQNNIQMTEQSTSTIPTVSIKAVKELMDKGYTRYTEGDKGHGSVQAHFNLSIAQMKELFAHPKLKFYKTKFPKPAKAPSVNVVDDEGINVVDDDPFS